jgi:hypothetical protein
MPADPLKETVMLVDLKPIKPQYEELSVDGNSCSTSFGYS